eukprot:Blabericola_migrator_1__2467@NODE_1696_length_3982_cov_82_762197_g354_i1_p3_GENE_NODE_1696_length_3982_cov_82_762197_g354_i1NODE_1696_length_3982_cov_82_762197_g354_i1_p3_ORF_typecomplete_len104_score4_61_NODE_1696_length_3982_cov_82_762197_g354_i134943805
MFCVIILNNFFPGFHDLQFPFNVLFPPSERSQWKHSPIKNPGMIQDRMSDYRNVETGRLERGTMLVTQLAATPVMVRVISKCKRICSCSDLLISVTYNHYQSL